MRHTSVCRSKNPANNYEQFTFKECIGSTFVASMCAYAVLACLMCLHVKYM